MVELTARVAIESLLRATDDDATPIIRRLARNQARAFLAATPTPPTLSEDLRQKAAVVLARAHGYDDGVRDGDQLHVAKILDAMTEFALAQVKAS